jgi:hypothetical protein
MPDTSHSSGQVARAANDLGVGFAMVLLLRPFYKNFDEAQRERRWSPSASHEVTLTASKIIHAEYERNLKSEPHAFAGVSVITWRLNPPNVVKYRRALG